MLHVSKDHALAPFEADTANVSSTGSPAQYIQLALGFLRRQWWVLAIAVVMAIIAATSYLLFVPATYRATATVGLDTAKFQLFQPAGELVIDTSSAVESQVEVLKSEKLALEVIKKLHLTDEIPPPTGGLFGSSKQLSEFEYTRQLVAVLQKHLTVKRLGIAWIIEISYESTDPERAAQFANAFADAYIADQLDARYQVTRQASAWLEGRVKEMRQQTLAAQNAVVEFRTKNNIIDTGGRLMSQQQLTDLNAQLLVARGQTSEAKARLDRVTTIVQAALAADNVNVLVTDVPINESIAKLRSQLIELTSKEREWSAKFGRDHLAVVNLHNQAALVRASMIDELRRVGEAYKSDYDFAVRKEKNLEGEVNQAISESDTSNRAQVKLRELESAAVATRDLYENLNKRYLESVEQKSFPVTEARVITKAVRPLDREFKTTFRVLAGILGVGLSLGVGLALVRELTDRVFRTADQIERRLQTNCIALVPFWKNDGTPKEKIANSGIAGTRTIAFTDGPVHAAIGAPLSSYAEAMRSIKLAIDLNAPAKSAKVIGFTSSLPREGKSTIAASLALTIARAGRKVALLDFDLRNPTLSRMLTPGVGDGFLEVISADLSLADALWTDETKNLSFLPTVTKNEFVQSNEIMASQATEALLDKLRNEYAYVVVDLPPLAPVVDTRATTHLVDSYIYVVEWGSTKIEVIEHALSRAPSVSRNVLGVVLNKVNMNELDKYDPENSRYYNNEHYSQYGYTHSS